MLPGYTPVIATYERPADLQKLLLTLAEQVHPPEQTIIVDASRDDQTWKLAEEMRSRLKLRYERAEIVSAAQQRNQAARLVTTPLVAFIDDDATLFPETCEKLCGVFENDPESRIGGVGGRMLGEDRPVPRGLLWWYYRLQAGFAHPTYGGKLFGPAINCVPSYSEASGEDLIPADWLPSTCVFYRTELFAKELFPSFVGYSFMEDVHLSARIGKAHPLFFHTSARFKHHDAPSTWKRDFRALARNRIRNQRLVAREILGMSGFPLETKLFLHRLFVTIYLLRRRGAGFREEIAGTWARGTDVYED